MPGARAVGSPRGWFSLTARQYRTELRGRKTAPERHSLSATPAWRAFLAILIGDEGQDSGGQRSARLALKSARCAIATHRRSPTRKELYFGAGQNGRVDSPLRAGRSSTESFDR